MYKAKENIGDFKKGDVVPDEIAEVWAKMYAVSPVEEVEGKEKPKVEALKEAPKSEVNPMLDDYLGRNTLVVLNNIHKDKLDKKTIEELIKLETSEKNRAKVIKALQKKGGN